MKSKQIKICTTLLFVILMTLCLSACNVKKSDKEIDIIYRTPKEWQERFALKEYQENKKLEMLPKGRPSATCTNGTFVGNNEDGIDVYRGIPYAQAPVGNLRFQKAKNVLPSDGIFDATYFGDSCLQAQSAGEAASFYHQSENCLNLNIWSNPESNLEKKPVLVYIHGGGFVSGGTSDPLYDGWNFAHYNPDVIVVTVGYRLGLLGFIDVSSFEGGDAKEYQTSSNNAFYDQIEALRWLKSNIDKFGGDPDNITICGESAGGAAVSILCVLDEAKGLFNKAIPMSGAVNLCVTPDKVQTLPAAVKEVYGFNTISEFQELPFNEFADVWRQEFSTIYNFPVMDGVSMPADMFKEWENGASKDITILQGHTQTEFRYYYNVFNCYKPMYSAVCDELVNYYKNQGTTKFPKLYEKYKDAIVKLGFDESEVEECFADDLTLAISNTYQATAHADNGGKGYSYTFAIPYDSHYDDFELGAAHAVDCFYLFGNFDGKMSLGTKEQVDASINFQKMIASFCKNGEPSIDGIKWPEYNNETRKKMIIGLDKFEVVENPEKERVDTVLEMLSEVKSKYSPGMSSIIASVYKKNPTIQEEMFSH